VTDPSQNARVLEARSRLWLNANGAEIAILRLGGSTPTAAQAARLEAISVDLKEVRFIFFVITRTDTDLGNTQSVPCGGERATVC